MSAEWFITGAAASARNFNVSPLIIGFTLVRFGTSAPEMLVAAMTVINPSPGLAVGNTIGSNIANITPVPGMAVLIMPHDAHSRVLENERLLLIGLTIIAVGTSLPELAASIAAALKNEHDLAIGNVVGTHIFNTLAVMGIPGLIYPSTLDAGVLDHDTPVVCIFTRARVIMVYGFKGHDRINRIAGAFVLACFVGYQVLLFFTEPQ